MLCARKDFIEQRHLLNLFALPPKDDQRIDFAGRDAFQLARTDGEEAEEQRPIIQKTTTTSHPQLLNLELPPSDPSSKIIQDFVIYDPAQFY